MPKSTRVNFFGSEIFFNWFYFSACVQRLRIRNVGQVISPIVSDYYLCEYKGFAFIFSTINVKFYI